MHYTPGPAAIYARGLYYVKPEPGRFVAIS